MCMTSFIEKKKQYGQKSFFFFRRTMLYANISQVCGRSICRTYTFVLKVLQQKKKKKKKNGEKGVETDAKRRDTLDNETPLWYVL